MNCDSEINLKTLVKIRNGMKCLMDQALALETLFQSHIID